tara:strand:+ start:59 stop:208 length:150 start_codon:yes stop_codon:yes gene_type:complete
MAIIIAAADCGVPGVLREFWYCAKSSVLSSMAWSMIDFFILGKVQETLD